MQKGFYNDEFKKYCILLFLLLPNIVILKGNDNV